jgi:mono/diheme cytochrome c family protein
MRLIGILLIAALLAALGIRFWLGSTQGFSARATPTAIEAFAAQTARKLALPTGARETPNPIPNSPEVLEEAMAHWADHCAICHANNGNARVSEMGAQMYPPAPDMRSEATQKLTDGELFYIIENGIRLTGMPAWGGSESAAKSSWKLVHFIRHLPQLSPDELAAMEKMNPKGPEDRQREEDESSFLNGGTPTQRHDQEREHQ